METATAPWTLTDFLQHSGRILREVEQGEIVLQRRGGDDLVVLARRHWEALSSSLLVLAEAYRDATEGTRQPSGEKRRSWFSLPWVSLLTSEDQAACIEDVSRTAIAALQSGRLAELNHVLARWRATALATWDEQQQPDGSGYGVDDAQPLPRP